MTVEFDNLDAIRDPRSMVHMNMTEDLRRERYRLLRGAGYSSYVAQRGRDWHEREFRSLLAIARVVMPGAINNLQY